MESDVFVIPFCRRHSSPAGQNGQRLIHSWEGWESPGHRTEPLARGCPSSCPCSGQGGAAPGILGWLKGQGSCWGCLTAAAGFIGIWCWGCPLQRQTSKLYFWLSLCVGRMEEVGRSRCSLSFRGTPQPCQQPRMLPPFLHQGSNHRGETDGKVGPASPPALP